MLPDRFHVSLALAGRVSMQGWWASEKTARRRFSSWVGEYGDRPDARITLTDEETGETVTEWPPVVGGRS